MSDLELLTAKEVCGLLKINPATLWRWVKAGTFPAPLAIGPNCTRWPQSKVREWIEQASGQRQGNKAAALESNELRQDAARYSDINKALQGIEHH